MLERVEIDAFRCLSHAVLEPAEQRTLICGPNASGKTSLLEAVFFLGRGQSFRTTDRQRLIQDGADALTVTGRVRDADRTVPLGVRWGQGSLEARIAGEPAAGRAALAELLPVQIIHAELHKLVEEGPGRRRRFLDWGLFHVKPPFLEVWRRYQRALRQRNAGLRGGLDRSALAGWEQELVASGDVITQMRRSYVRDIDEAIQRMGRELLGLEVTTTYQPGYAEEGSLADALARQWERDRENGQTHVGPHRGDLLIRAQGKRARYRVSRGQQKLVAAALVLAQTAHMTDVSHRSGVLLLDDPAAELDEAALDRLANVVLELDAQVIVTSLEADQAVFLPGRTFHVKQGELRRVV